MITWLITWYVDITSFWDRSAEQLTSEPPTFRPYENLWRSPIRQSFDCAITGNKYSVQSHFGEPLVTVNWPTSPRRNSLPLSPHHNSRAKVLLWKYSKTISKLALAKFPHHPRRYIQRLLRLQNCLSRNQQSSIKQYPSRNQQSSIKQYPSRNQQPSIKQYPSRNQQSSIKQYPSRNQQSSIKQYPSSNQRSSTSSIPAETSNHPSSSIPAASSGHQPAVSQPKPATSNQPATSILAATSNHPTSDTYTTIASFVSYHYGC